VGGAAARAYDYWDEEEESYEEEIPAPRPTNRQRTKEVPNQEFARHYSFLREQNSELIENKGYQQGRQWQHYSASGQYSQPKEAEITYQFAVPARTAPALKMPPLLDYVIDYWPRVANAKLLLILLGVAVGWFLITMGLPALSKGAAQSGRYMSVAMSQGGSAPVIGGNSNSSRVLGQPSISPSKIDAVLKSYNSPATGVGQAMYDKGLQYGIDPAYALAFFVHESTAGTRGIATVTKSIGNIRYTSGYENYQGFRKYPTWEAGIEDWYKLIKELYVNGWKLSTVEAIVPVYAPAADSNNPAAYIKSVNDLVATWRASN